jgi:hypothetical protein
MKKTIVISSIVVLLCVAIGFNWNNIKSGIRVLKMDNSTAVTVDAVHEYLKWKVGVSSEIYDEQTIAIRKWKDCNILMQIQAPDKIYLFAASSYEFRSPEEGEIVCPLQQAVDNALDKYSGKGVDIWIPKDNIVELAIESKFSGMGDFKSKFYAYGERLSNAAYFVRDEALRLTRNNLQDQNHELLMLQCNFWGASKQ